MLDLDNIYAYRAPKNDQVERYQTIRDMAKSLAQLIEIVCPDSREKSLAFTKLEECTMWANSAIARNE